jgi:type IV pilus assembly protein PilC
MLREQGKDNYLSIILGDVVKRLEEGEALSSSLSRYPTAFDQVYISSIKAAEVSGKLEEILMDLAEQNEREYKLISAVKGAVTYPILIVVFMIFAAAILMTIVVPKFETLFAEASVQLPLATKILISTSTFLAKFWYIVVFVFFAAVIWLRYYFKTQNGRAFTSRLILATPFFRDFFTDVYMARFSHTLGMLVGAGVPIVESVQIVSTVINNTVFEETLKKVSHQLERGIAMSTPISEAKEFPPIVYQMIAVGEQTGKLDETMTSLSTYFEEETANRVKALSSIIEPLLIFIVGIGVGTMVFAIIVPIYQISMTIQ